MNWNNIKDIWSLLRTRLRPNFVLQLKQLRGVNEEEKDNERQNNNTNGDDDENDDDRGVVLKHHHHHHHHHPMLFEYHDAASCKIEYSSSKTLR